MKSKRSLLRSRAERPARRPLSADRRPAAGFTLVELLVALGVAGIMLGSAVKFVSMQTHTDRRHASEVESEQANRSSLDAMTRDLRLAGACLPTDGQFIALEGTDGVGGDSITIRAGLVATNACVVTSLSVLAPKNATTVTVPSTQGFTAGTLGYLRHPNGAGQILSIKTVTATTITFGSALVQDYPIGSGVYGVDERVYAIDRSNPSRPLFTLTVNRGVPQPFAVGMTDFQVRYVLARNCQPCDQVDLPRDTVEWRLVNSIVLTTTVEPVRPGGYYVTNPTDQPPLTATATVKPRNLLP